MRRTPGGKGDLLPSSPVQESVYGLSVTIQYILIAQRYAFRNCIGIRIDIICSLWTESESLNHNHYGWSLSWIIIVTIYIHNEALKLRTFGSCDWISTRRAYMYVFTFEFRIVHALYAYYVFE